MSIALVIAAAVVFAVLGSRWAVASRARGDYVKVRDGLPGMRDAAWRAFWAAARTVALVVLVVGGYSIWQARDITPGGAATDVRRWGRDRLPSAPATTPPAKRPRTDADANQVTRDGRVICFSRDCARERDGE